MPTQVLPSRLINYSPSNEALQLCQEEEEERFLKFSARTYTNKTSDRDTPEQLQTDDPNSGFVTA